MPPILELIKFTNNVQNLKNHKNIIIKMLFFFHLFKIILNECDRNTPIKLSNDECILKYCTKEEYDLEECTINNTIIKTQFPNKIIIIGEESFKYINFFTLSNGDMIIETSPYPRANKRIFFGLKTNGRYYFNKTSSNEESPFNSLIIDDETEYKYESGNSIIINEGKEYLISTGRLSSYTELFDFDNGKIISKRTKELIGHENKNIRSNLIRINKERNTFIFPCLSEVSNITSGIIMKFDLEFKSNRLVLSDKTERTIKYGFGNISSCFKTEKNKLIICFHGYKKNSEVSSFIFLAYNESFKPINETYFTPSGINLYVYFYSIFFREDSGAFIYYKTEKEISYPIIFFKKYDLEDNSFKNYFPNNNLIILDKYIFNTGYNLNELIKISDSKLAFIAGSKNLETLFIVILNIFNINNKNSIKIRYYSIETYKLLNYRISDDIRGYIFNDFIIVGVSYCLIGQCNKENWTKYSSTIMIIGYPNKDDGNFDIINYLLLDNDNSIENIALDLSKNMTIDNNIFGYIYDGIKIKNVESKGYIYLVASPSNKIIDNSIHNEIGKNEKVKIEFKNNLYNKSKCILEYSYIVTEPEYEKFEKYPINISNEYGGDNIKSFNEQKHRYIGKSIYYYIYLSEDLTNDCKNVNCSLCFEKNISCITYRSYTEFKDSESTQIPTNEITNEILTEFKESEISESQTDEIKTVIITEFKDSNIIKIPSDEIKTEININFQTELINNKSGKYNCTNQEIFQNKCQNEKMNNEQIKYFYSKLKDEITKNITNSTKMTIKTENAIFQLLLLNDIKNQDEEDKYISTIDLGECLDILKESTVHPLKILKVDIKSEDLTSTYVQYEVYDSVTGDKINLRICDDIIIKINVPKKLDDDTLNIFNNLENSGYNFLNKNDSFYKDICSTYTSEDGKDVLLSDRYNDIYVHINEIYFCQSSCKLVSYNTTTEKAECDCKIQEEEIKTSLENINFTKEEIIDAFVGALQNSNFMVLKCYKLLLNFSKLLLNYGFIIMSIILLCKLILMIVYCFKGRKKISELIAYFIKIKFENEGINKPKKSTKKNITKRYDSKEKIEKKKKEKKEKNTKTNKKEKFDKNKKNEKKNKSILDSINKNTIKIKKNNKENKENNKLKNKDKLTDPSNIIINKKNINKEIKIKVKPNKSITKNNFPPKKMNGINHFKISNNIYNLNFNNINNSVGNSKKILIYSKNKIHLNRNKFLNSEYSKSKYTFSESQKFKENNKDKNNKIINKKDNKYHKLNDQEMNSLDYNSAIKLDKRTYFQYYYSLLKKKQLILFAFYPNNDYNLVTLKISLFLLSFSLYFTINGFFFSDNTMHKIYEDESSFNILNQISIIIYSSLISSVLNMILKQLSLSENNILSIAKIKEYKNGIKKSKAILKCLKIKFFLFFLLSLPILLFCWYFISCFCVVYTNTQMILISDSFISFGISMLYPFCLSLLPGFFRIPSLRAKHKDKIYIYKISQIIALV